jgi:hypothetical protein
VDQNDRTKQGFDVQLYSAGDPFAFGFTGTRVSIDEQASLIARKQTHEVISPSGSNLSAEELAARELSVLSQLGLPSDQPGGAPSFGSSPVLVSLNGTAVNAEEACDAEGGQGSGATPNENCEEK